MKNSICLLVALAAVPAFAAPSSPPPSSSGGQGESARPARRPVEITFYNDGTLLLFRKEWADAQQQFEAALAIDERMAEAHNNLAYVLRQQGETHYPAALEHYNRAIALKPRMAEAYMYRGALYALSGRAELARGDYDTLVKMKSKLAPHLRKIIDTGKEEQPEQFYGVTKKKK
jgi:tetratricopeptide (TPR) repeat protein